MKRLLFTSFSCFVALGSVLVAQQPAPMPACVDCPEHTCKTCVVEPKHNTKTVYACQCEEYCLPRCSFLSLFLGKCGCDDGNCCELKVRHRLLVRKVEAPDTKQCVLHEVPAGDCEHP